VIDDRKKALEERRIKYNIEIQLSRQEEQLKLKQ
jgi:hypothetical protein